jgi:hypothetical protein
MTRDIRDATDPSVPNYVLAGDSIASRVSSAIAAKGSGGHLTVAARSLRLLGAPSTERD